MNINFTSLMNRFFKKSRKQVTCTECLQSLQMVVDGEATPEQEEYFKTHLDECLPCYNFYSLEKCVKEALQTKIKKKSVPADLAENIKNKLRQSL